MRIWLSKSSEVPLRQQLASQITLGIISGDFQPHQKLPSTRELSLRLQIHSNTVSAAYRDLANRGWVEFRKGSGVYVRELHPNAEGDAQLELDRLISNLLQTARAKGYAMSDIAARLKHWIEAQPPDRFLLIEPDARLGAILAAEIRQATGFGVECAGLTDCERRLTGAAPVALYSRAEMVRAALPPDTSFLLLHMRSVSDELQGRERPTPDDLITVVSHWDELFKWAKTILVAAGVDADTICFRDAKRRDWQKGLAASWLVITDALTAEKIPASCTHRVFHIIADSSLDELRRFKNFLAKPLTQNA